MTTLLRGQSRAAELMSPVDLVQDSAEKTIKKGLHFCKPLISLVPGARLELARGCPRRILSPLRLPIPPSRQTGHHLQTVLHVRGVSGFVAQGTPIRQVTCPQKTGPPKKLV